MSTNLNLFWRISSWRSSTSGRKNPHCHTKNLGQAKTNQTQQISGVRKRVVSKRVCFSGCSLDPQNRNEGTKNGMTDPQNQNKGTKSGTTVPKTGTRVHSPNHPFTKPPCLLPLENCKNQDLPKMALVGLCACSSGREKGT